MEDQRRLDNLNALNSRFRATNMSSTSLHKKRLVSKEKSAERSLKQKTVDLVARHRPPQTTKAAAGSASTEFMDIRDWISDQMLSERMLD